MTKHFGASTGTAWEDLPKEVQDAVLFGTGKTDIEFVYDDGLRTYKTKKTFEGVIGNLERRYKETESAGMREEIERYMSIGALPRLQRLPAEARGAGGQDRWPPHRPGLGDVDPRRGAMVHRHARAPERRSRTRSASACSRKSASASASSTMSASII